MPSPFRIVPWDVDFIEALKTGIMRTTHGHPGNAVVVFMNERPRRYLIDSFRKDFSLPKPLLLPVMLTLRELIVAFRQAWQPDLRQEAGRLDQIALLFACIRDLAQPGTELCQRLAQVDEAAFFPWGTQLADLMEECFTQALTPSDMAYTENEVAPFGAALLGSLGKIFARYYSTLDQHGLTTPGLDAFYVTEQLKNTPPLPSFLRERSILLAGFTMLTGTEDKLFRYLWYNGAQIYLHTDPALASGDTVHWACAEQHWISAWNAKSELECPPTGRTPRIHYFAGFDLHSQLESLRADLLELDAVNPSDKHTAPGIAIALTHSAELLPVLHQIPHKDCNISLGYPLERSLLFRLLDTVIAIRDDRKPDGQAHWRALTELVRHPYLRLLQNHGIPLRNTLQRMETKLRTGNLYVEPHAIAKTALKETLAMAQPSSPASTALPPLIRQLLEAFVDSWCTVRTLRDVADALSHICDTLLTYGRLETGPDEAEKSIWDHFPIDAECLFRFMQKIIPALKDNIMADTKLPWPLLRSMLRDLIRKERVPFEADPLTGLQILGMLETRLLHFQKVFIVDATEDHLPGAPIRSALLPDSLRAVLGLPDTRNRDVLAAHTFYHLLAGADEVWLYWQEGVKTSALLDSKKQRSRLIEEFVWHEEQRLGQRLKPGQSPLRMAVPRVHLPQKAQRFIIKTAAIRQQIHTAMGQTLSSNWLNSYLLCPLRAFFEQICSITPEQQEPGQGDTVAVGLFLHTVLKKFYDPYLGDEANRISSPNLSKERLCELFHTELATSSLRDMLSPEGAALFSVSGPERLARYLANQPEKTYIRALEESFSTTFAMRNTNIKLTGRIDRVDWRSDETGEGAIILDYKTGHIELPDTSIWEDQAFWERISDKNAIETAAESTPELDILPIIANRIHTIQLPVYCHLYGQTTGEPVHNAAYVELANEGEEIFLFKKDIPPELREHIRTVYIPNLIRFIFLHMELCPEIRPQEGEHCRWCSWQNVCIISSRDASKIV